MSNSKNVSRRAFLAGSLAAAAAARSRIAWPADMADVAADRDKALIALTLDLEMSRNFPTWETTHWDYEKGNLDEPTKQYAVEAGRRAAARGAVVHYFCVGRVLEQEDASWLKGLAQAGHKIGNHTYDHVNVLAKKAEDLQFRFRRAPWLIEGRQPADVIRENIRLTNLGLKERVGITAEGFRTPGGFAHGLADREDLQQMLLDLGFTWASCQYPAHKMTEPMQSPDEDVLASIVAAHAATQPFVYPTGLVEVPMSPVSDINAFRAGRWKLDDFLEAIRRAVTHAIENRLVFDYLGHPSCMVVTDPEFKVFDLICGLVEQAGPKAAVADLSTIARRARLRAA
ncbi:MAG: polysaccharide deacetylase family protein [Pirellulales bacterium]